MFSTEGQIAGFCSLILCVFIPLTRYIRRTTRRLSDRVREHHSGWLSTGTIEVIARPVSLHVDESNHSVIVGSTFRNIYKLKSRHSRTVKRHISNTAEAVSIRFRNSILCVQKQFIQTHILQLHKPADTFVELWSDATVNWQFLWFMPNLIEYHVLPWIWIT